MEEKLQPFDKTRVLIAEKEAPYDIEPSFAQPIEKKESAKKILFENNDPQKRVEFELKKDTSAKKTNFEFEATQTFINKKTEVAIESAVQTVTEDPPKIEQKVERITEPDKESATEEKQTTQQSLFTLKQKRGKAEKKPAKIIRPGLKSRLKIILFGFIAVLTCFIGWSIYNAVEIETLRAQMQESNKVYAVNIANYINNISKTDDLTSADSLLNLDKLNDAKIITVVPTIEPHIEYSVNSNWFDSLCNWIANIFK